MARYALPVVVGLLIFLLPGCGDQRHFQMGVRYQDQEEYARAANEFQYVLQTYPNSDLRKKSSRRLKYCKAAVEAQSMLIEADRIFELGDPDSALRAYNEALIYMVQANLKNTDAIRTRIEELRASKIAALEYMGDLYLNDKMYQYAIDEYYKAWDVSGRDNNSPIAAKIDSIERKMVTIALEQMIAEAEKARNIKPQAAPKQAPKKQTIDIITGPGSASRERQQDSEVDMTRLYSLREKMDQGDLTANEQGELLDMAEEMGIFMPSSRRR